jgi:hypothetical protein
MGLLARRLKDALAPGSLAGKLDAAELAAAVPVPAGAAAAGAAGRSVFPSAAAAAGGAADKPELFYTLASEGLKEARTFIAKDSFERAHKRLRAEEAVASSADVSDVYCSLFTLLRAHSRFYCRHAPRKINMLATCIIL